MVGTEDGSIGGSSTSIDGLPSNDGRGVVTGEESLDLLSRLVEELGPEDSSRILLILGCQDILSKKKS